MPQTKPPDSAGMTTLSATLQLARQRFFEDGSDPQGAVPELIARSWRRCSALPATLSEIPEPLAHDALFARRDAQGRLRRHALPELEALAEALSPSRVVVLLADPQGMILDAAGSDVFMNKAQRVALMPGVEWSEVQRGTNAIGTALTEVSPITVLGHQHYLEQNGALGCTAAPLLGSEGQ
ncbi:MAG: sigma-54-dependent Fis family transcriptional regulator, partial [Betaproteobacteria bacterium]|nr:sigma-54-dependent Fis family transcriptional regulator [Betaproteobacteria bacterium]